MNLSEEVDLESFVSRPDKISGAEISAICLEAGMQAVRKNRCSAVLTIRCDALRLIWVGNRYMILQRDFEKAYKINVKKDSNEFDFYK